MKPGDDTTVAGLLLLWGERLGEAVRAGSGNHSGSPASVQ